MREFWSGEQINPRWISNLTALVTRTWAWLEVLTSLPVSILPLVFPFPFHLSFPALVGQADFSPTHHCHPDALAHLRPKGRSWLTAKPPSMCWNKPSLPRTAFPQMFGTRGKQTDGCGDSSVWTPLSVKYGSQWSLSHTPSPLSPERTLVQRGKLSSFLGFWMRLMKTRSLHEPQKHGLFGRKLPFIDIFVCLCVCLLIVCLCLHHRAHVEVREQGPKVVPLLPQYRSQGSNLGW